MFSKWANAVDWMEFESATGFRMCQATNLKLSFVCLSRVFVGVCLDRELVIAKIVSNTYACLMSDCCRTFVVAMAMGAGLLVVVARRTGGGCNAQRNG